MQQVAWSMPKRIAFRFGFCLFVLYVYPAPFGMIPKTQFIADALGKPWEWLVVWFAETFFGQTPPVQPTGSGDTLFAWVAFLVMVILAALATAIWSALDRKRLAYPRLASATWIGLRYLLAFTLYGYGFAKIVDSQFPPPGPHRLDERLGDMSPMGLLWTFQGASIPYTIFGGLCEATAATLLLWRRTATLGALVAMGVMTNVVMLNFCYDVPVKLYALQLLVMAALIALPQLHRLLLAVLGHAAPEVPPRIRSSVRRERARLALKIAVLGFIVYNIREEVTMAAEYSFPPTELTGTWKVDTFAVDGITYPASDERRWCKLIVSEWGVWAKNCADAGEPQLVQVLPAAQAILVTDPQNETSELWHYRRTGEHLVVDAPHAGKQLHVTATKNPEALLTSRGFHWVQEFPFNR